MKKSDARLTKSLGKFAQILGDVIKAPKDYSQDVSLRRLLERHQRLQSLNTASQAEQRLSGTQGCDLDAERLSDSFTTIDDLRRDALEALLKHPCSDIDEKAASHSNTVPQELERVVTHLFSVRNFYFLLLDVERAPRNYLSDMELLDSLKAQHRFARFCRPDLGIKGASLNTFKDYANEVFVGKFEEIDKIRLLCIDALEREGRAAAPRRVTAASLSRQLKEKEQQIDLLMGDLWNLTRAYFGALKNARSYARESGKPAIIARCAAEEEELRAIAAMVRTSPYSRNTSNE